MEDIGFACEEHVHDITTCPALGIFVVRVFQEHPGYKPCPRVKVDKLVTYAMPDRLESDKYRMSPVHTSPSFIGTFNSHCSHLRSGFILDKYLLVSGRSKELDREQIFAVDMTTGNYHVFMTFPNSHAVTDSTRTSPCGTKVAVCENFMLNVLHYNAATGAWHVAFAIPGRWSMWDMLAFTLDGTRFIHQHPSNPDTKASRVVVRSAVDGTCLSVMDMHPDVYLYRFGGVFAHTTRGWVVPHKKHELGTLLTVDYDTLEVVPEGTRTWKLHPVTPGRWVRVLPFDDRRVVFTQLYDFTVIQPMLLDGERVPAAAEAEETRAAPGPVVVPTWTAFTRVESPYPVLEFTYPPGDIYSHPYESPAYPPVPAYLMAS